MQTLTKFLNTSNSAEGQKDAQVLLDSLGHSNPKYQSRDSQDLEAELLCISARPRDTRGSADTRGHAGEEWALLGAMGSVTTCARPYSGRNCACLLGIVAVLYCLEENSLENCVKTVPVSPFPARYYRRYEPCVLLEPALCVLCSVHLQIQYKGGSVYPHWAVWG